MDKPFLIYKLDAATIGEIVKDPPAPHRHEYEELIILLDGTPEHFIDFRKQTIQSPAIIYVSKGKIHQFMPDLQTAAGSYNIRMNLRLKAASIFIPTLPTPFIIHCLNTLVIIGLTPYALLS